jgi:hypothetical protein
MFQLFSILGLISLSILVYNYIISPIFFSPLSPIPKAHFTSSISSVWIWWQRRNGKTGIRLIFTAHERYGPVVQLSPNELSVASLDGLRQIYRGGFDKSSFYEDFISYGTPNLVSTLQSKPHSIQKRMLSHVYSKSYVQNSKDLQTATRVILFENLFPALELAAAQHVPYDAYSLNHAIGADFISSYLFGLSNCTNFISDIETRDRICDSYRTRTRELPGKDKATREVEEFVASLCKDAQEFSEKGSGDRHSTRPVVHERLSSRLAETNRLRSDKIVASEMFDHMVAAIETSRIILTYIQWELSQRPELQNALRKELLGLSPAIINPPKRNAENEEIVMPDPKEIDSLPLLDAILKETLRLYSPSPAIQPRVTPPGGTTIDGFSIPGGITLGTSAYCLHMNERVFPNAAQFIPERWLKSEDPDRLREMNQWFWAFGSGSRMCIANHFALNSKSYQFLIIIVRVLGKNSLLICVLVMKIATAAIYTNYETEIVEAGEMAQEDMFIAGPVGEKLVLKFRNVGLSNLN